MTVISMNYLLEAGVQFGHQKRRWNPKMKEYIFTTRDDIYIIDLQKTVKKLEEAYEAMKEIAQNEGIGVHHLRIDRIRSHIRLEHQHIRCVDKVGITHVVHLSLVIHVDMLLVERLLHRLQARQQRRASAQ